MRFTHWKKALSILALTSMVVGCGTQAASTSNTSGTASNSSNTSSSSTVKVKPITIAVVSLFADDEWSKEFLSGITDMSKKYKDINLIQTQASYDQSQMVTQLETVIQQHPDVIIVNHASQSAALQPAIQKAVNQGIKVITVSLVMPIPGVSQAHQNNAQLAQLSLDEMAKEIHDKGNIAVIWTGGFAPMEERQTALQAFEKVHPNIHVIATYGDASSTTISDTVSRTEALLRQYPNKGQLTAIWASWDQFAIGAVRAESILHRNIPVFGIDFSAQDASMMRAQNSPWKATASTDTYEYGAGIMRYAILDAYGQKIPDHIWVPGALITQSTLPAAGENLHQYFLKLIPSEKNFATSSFLTQLQN